MKPEALMIFAAGLGTRMRPLTDDRPKPLIAVGGQTLLDRALDLGRAGGARRIVVNTHYKGQMIADHLAGQDVAISHEPGPVLETGGGLRAALPVLGAGSAPGAGPVRWAVPVMTLNPDGVWTGPNPLAALREAWDGDRMDALMMLVPMDRALARLGGGDFGIDDQGRIARGGAWVYAGAHVLNPVRLDAVRETVFSLNVVWDRIIADGRAFGLVHPGRWCDVGRPETIAVAETMLAEDARADG